LGALGGGAGRRAGRLWHSPFVARQAIFGTFPWHQEVELAEVLRQLDRLINDALLGFRISELDIAVCGKSLRSG
jgi:hypothetical protein